MTCLSRHVLHRMCTSSGTSVLAYQGGCLPNLQDLCRDKHADVQEGLVHFFPALLAHLPSTTRSSFFQSLILSLSLDCATWRCRIGLATQLGSLATLEVPLTCLYYITVVMPICIGMCWVFRFLPASSLQLVLVSSMYVYACNST